MNLNNRNNLKQKLKNREVVFGTWTSIGHTVPTEIFSLAGTDFVGIDVEHSTINQNQAMAIIMAAQSRGVSCFPRIASHNYEDIKRLTDAGADGIIVPMVDTKEQAEKLIKAFFYTPAGGRSFGISRAQDFGFGFSEYVENWNATGCLIIQIESVLGVENLDSILSTKMIDAVMIGPYDISGSLGIPGQIDHPKVKKACEDILKICQKHKVSCGTQIVEPDKKSIEDTISNGFNFIVLSSDVFLLWKWSAKMKGLIIDYRSGIKA